MNYSISSYAFVGLIVVRLVPIFRDLLLFLLVPNALRPPLHRSCNKSEIASACALTCLVSMLLAWPLSTIFASDVEQGLLVFQMMTLSFDAAFGCVAWAVIRRMAAAQKSRQPTSIPLSNLDRRTHRPQSSGVVQTA